MSKYAGKCAVVEKGDHNGINTNGLCCTIVRWNASYKKYEVDFENGWCGWYKLSELKIDGRK